MSKRKLGLFFASLSLSIGAFSFAIFSNSSQQKENIVTFATYTNGDAATYYNGISDTATGNTLLTQLRELNLSKRKDTVGYNSMGTTPSGQFKYTDYDPNYVQYDSNGQPYGTRISSFYTYTSATGWNREHVWPNSHGGGSGGSAGSPYPDADIHMPRPTISSENSSRGNSFFVEGMNHSSNGWDPLTAGYSEQSRGEAARITFYCMTVNSKLALAPNNTAPGGKDPITGNTMSSGNTMGNLETLLKWTINYPVTQREKNRNEGAEYLQGNRNAFVDHPEYACRIWGGVNSKTKSLCDSASWVVSDGISITRETANIAVGDVVAISANASDGSTVSWTTSNATVASISSSTGNNISITGNAEGSATITASATIKNTVYTATCEVTVTESGSPIDEGEYVLVTSNTQLKNGDKVVITMDRSREEIMGVTGWNNSNDATVSNSESNWKQFVVESASSSGWKLKDTTVNQYIAAPTSNHFKYGSTGGTISVDDEGHFFSNNRYLCKNGTYYRCYGSIGSYIPFFIYKVNTDSPVAKTLSSISISDETTVFDVGEEYVSPTVTAHYSDGSTADVTSNATFTGYNMSVAGNYTVTVSYTEGEVTKTTTYSISVIEPITLSSITIGSGYNTSFYVGDTFSFGGTVTAHYSDGSSEDVTSEASFTGYNMSNTGNQTVTVSYTFENETKTTTYTINVKAVVLSSIAVTTDITNKTQYVGATFSSAGLVVTATYNNGSTKNVTSSCTITPPDMSTTGQKTVGISYTEGNITRTTSTTINVVAAPTVSYYQKVTSTSEIESGQYLIVYETSSVALNGGLSTFDVASNTIGVTINNGQILSSSAVDAAAFTIDKATGALKGASGKYAGVNSYSNGLATSTSVIANSFAIENNNAKITVTTSGGTMTMKYNDASDQKRFRYYKSGQKEIQLYKLVASGGGGGDEPTLTSISLELNDVGTYFELGSEFSYEGLVVYAHYSDNSSVPVTDYTVSTPDMNTLGQQEVTVTYQGQTAKYTIEVFTDEEPSDYSLTSGSPYMNDVPYKMYFDNTLNKNSYYFTGSKSGYYGTTSTTKSSGVDVYFEQGESGQYLYFNLNSTKQYISIVQNGTHYNFNYDTNKPSSEWEYNSTYGCLVLYFGETPFTVGAYDTNTMFGTTNLSKYTSNYNVQFITKDNEGAIPFATIMNEYITCDSTGAKGPTFKEGFDWNSFKDVYTNLDEDSQTTLKLQNPSNEEVSEFVARYDYIVGKYGTNVYNDFLGRNPSPISSLLNANFDLEESNSMLIIILVATGISFLSLTLLLIKKKRRI